MILHFDKSKVYLQNTWANKACTRRWGVWRDSKQFSTPQHFPSRTASPSPPQRSPRKRVGDYVKGYKMNDDFRSQVFNTLNQKETQDLIETWQENDRVEWSDLAFDVIKEILQTRLGEIPPQAEPIYEYSNEVSNELDSESEDESVSAETDLSQSQSKCPVCQGDQFEWGAVQAQGLNFHSEKKSWLEKNFSFGFSIRARVCLSCGNLQLFTNVTEQQ